MKQYDARLIIDLLKKCKDSETVIHKGKITVKIPVVYHHAATTGVMRRAAVLHGMKVRERGIGMDRKVKFGPGEKAGEAFDLIFGGETPK